MIKNTITFLTLVLFILSCNQESDKLFQNLSHRKTGIEFKNILRETEVFNVLKYGYFYNGGGVAVGDVNNDGLADIYFTGNLVASHLYLNKGDWKFENIAGAAGVEAAGLWNTGVTMADVNGDGWLDIYVCRSAAADAFKRENLLFINNGVKEGEQIPTFTEKAAEYGLADPGYSTQAAFLDYDRDGDLDMFLLNHSVQEFAGFSRFLESYKNKINPAYGDKLYRNEDGLFLDVTFVSGIKTNVLGFGLGVAIDDINGDNWPDIYISNDYNEEDYLYINQRNGKFKESLAEYFDHVSMFSMGSDITDINNDGLPDVMSLDMLPEDNFRQKMTSGSDNFDKKQILYGSGFYYQSMRNMLQLNNGDGSFSEIGQLAGVSNTDWSWAALFADYDNDGWKDLFVTNGYKSDYTNMDFMAYAADQQVKSQKTGAEVAVADLLEKIPSIVIPNYMYKNNGDLTFDKVTEEWGLDQPSLSNGAAYADLDNDGDLDLVVNNVNDFAFVYRNNADQNPDHHFLKIKLKGVNGNTYGIGAKVIVKAGDKEMYQMMMPTRGFQSAVEPVLHFGLGQNTTVDRIRVIWPDGQAQILENPEADQLLEIQYAPNSEEEVIEPAGKFPPLFTSTSEKQYFDYTHQENPYNDFKREPLLPHMYSTQGPRLTTGDVNDDGMEDVFIGGAKGYNGQLFVQQMDGSFAISPQSAFLEDSPSEDLESVFFDADGDGDLDLYVTSGGIEFDSGDAALQDRLYLNNGRGLFSKAANHLPEMLTSTTCVAPADIDGDGDTDLFAGGRLVPGSYPLPPRSYILQNDGTGHFTDITETINAELQVPGMVCDALWTDYNNDQRPDLIIVGEWMAVRIFENTGSKLKELPSIENSTGWWNHIAAGDMDDDGDTDYILANFGENAEIKASPAEPVSIYAKDFDNNGALDPIICYYIQGESYPMPAKDDLLQQIVSLKKKFVYYEDYAKATINDIFSEEELSDALKLQAATFSSSYMENLGDGQFQLTPLPTQAQLAPMYTTLIKDFNGDSHMDVLMGGNLTETRVQMGRYDASKGVLLLGNGRGGFRAARNADTGLLIRGSVRDFKVIESKDQKQLIIIARNKAPLQVLEWGNSEIQ